LTKVNDELFSEISLGNHEKVNFKSKDGTNVEGFVIKPSNFDSSKKYPLILWIHGGPISQYTYSLHTTGQIFASNGYVVLLVNPRGSTGYGEEFCKAIFADWGNKDYEDVIAGVDYLVELGYVDENKLGVGGWSYGGILTNHVITQTKRFKGAVSGASLGIVRANFGHDQYVKWYNAEFGMPWENTELWERLSPFNKVEYITTPTLWMGGSADWNLPIINSEQMYLGMKSLGRETQLVVYPGEHHGIRRPSFQRDRWQRWLDWFDKYLE
jgi:dipeptidyl aminopeptidase/acylaminoacyl peptidase